MKVGCRLGRKEINERIKWEGNENGTKEKTTQHHV
jgi:hypothetical protein